MNGQEIGALSVPLELASSPMVVFPVGCLRGLVCHPRSTYGRHITDKFSEAFTPTGVIRTRPDLSNVLR